jgi:hypothetical protein
MARFGFTTGGSYTSESPNVAAQRAVNWYPENVEGDGTTPTAYYPTPGLNPLCILTGTKVRGMYEYNNRLFVVTDKFYEVFVDGTFTAYSFLPDDGLPVTMEANSVGQLLICAAGQLWYFPLATPATFSNIAHIQVTVNSITHLSTLIVTFTGAVTLPANTAIYFSGLTVTTGLNGLSVNNEIVPGSAVSHSFTQTSGNWINAFGGGVAYGPTTETGTLATATNIQVTTGILGAVSMIAFVDGYFIALLANSSRFQISDLEDVLTWNPLNVFQISEFADNVTSMIVNQRQIFFLGRKRSLVYYDSGDPLIPFQPVPGAFIEQGITAEWSVCRMDNSIFWIGQDERGRAIAWRMNGYTPVRVSNYAVENIWRQYVFVADAIAYTYQQNGHTFWVIWFPTANATWVYDAATGQWHERVWLHNGAQNAHRSRCAAYAFGDTFGNVLVGDTQSGQISIFDINQTLDLINGVAYPILRIRRAPHISNEQEWMYHQQLQVYLESGLGDSNTPNPQISLRWSNDGGHTWSNYYAVSAGAQGNFTTRCMWRRLGRARDRIYEISVSDPIPWRIVDSFLQAVPGFTPSQRLVDQFKQRA